MKKLFSLILSFVLILTIIPSLSVNALTHDEEFDADIMLFGETTSAKFIAKAGTSGINVWINETSVDSTVAGVLTIPESVSYESEIHPIIQLDSALFENFTGITELVLSENLENISNTVFTGCTNLKSIIVPINSNINTIQEDTFSNPINIIFKGDFKSSYTDVINNLPTNSKVFYLDGASGWDTVSDAMAYTEFLELNVFDGSKTLSYPSTISGETISITADTSDATKIFSHWTSENTDVTFADKNSATTTFVMPDSDVTVTAIYKADSSVTAPDSGITLTYDKEAVTLADLNLTIVGDGSQTVKWYNSTDTTTEISAPTNAGSYKAGISLLEGDTHLALSETFIDFTIEKAASEITFNTTAVNIPYVAGGVTLDVNDDFDYTFVGEYSNPEGTGLFSKWYNSNKDQIYAPTEAGTYFLALYYTESNNYLGLAEVLKPFTITPITLSGSVKIDHNDKDANSKVSANDLLSANTASLNATGSTYTYQWKLNGNNITGATNNTYTVPSGYTDGKYTVAVSVTKNYSGTITSNEIGEIANNPPPAHYVTSGANQSVAQNKAITFKTDIHHSNFAGIWVDGASKDVNTIATITEGEVSVTLKSSFVSSLSQGEHLISFIAKDGGIASTYFTVTAPVAVATTAPTAKPTATPSPTPTSTPIIEDEKVPEASEPVVNPQNDDSSFPLIPVAIGTLVAILGIVFIIKKRSA